LESLLSPTPQSVPRTFGIAMTIAVLAFAGACSNDTPEDAAATSPSSISTPSTSSEAAGAGTATAAGSTTAPAAGTPTPTEREQTAGVQADPDPARVLEHIRYLAVEIGPRPAGSEAERQAATYIAEQLTQAGYDTTIEEFTFRSQLDDSLVTTADGTLLRALAMEGSPRVEATGIAIHAGLGEPADLAGADLAGKVVIFDRGVVTFEDKARAAEVAGAIAVIVVNNEPGLFRGALGSMTAAIPVVGVGGDEAAALQAAIGTRLTVHANAGMEDITSQNVVGRIGANCHAYLGAHYDSVPVSPGANDNASGTAVVLEVARTNPVEGLCVVLFGAEELGLYGSQSYVAGHLAGTGRFMLNVDMAGRLDGPVVVGDRDLIDDVLAAVDAAGINMGLSAGRFPPGASSDHVSFAAVGVPAVTFNSGNDAAIHTAQDTIDRIEPNAVAMFVAAVDAALDALVREHADALPR